MLVYWQHVLLCLPNTFQRLLSDASRQYCLTKGPSSASAVAFRPQATNSSLWVTCIRQMSQMQGREDPTTGGRRKPHSYISPFCIPLGHKGHQPLKGN
ncbi:uncharacterized [Tachysurus ichikawai]